MNPRPKSVTAKAMHVMFEDEPDPESNFVEEQKMDAPARHWHTYKPGDW